MPDKRLDTVVHRALDPMGLIDVEHYPLHLAGTAAYARLLRRCRNELAEHGTYDLGGFLRPDAISRAVSEMRPLIDEASFLHDRTHNVWFLPAHDVAGVLADHPSLREMRTSNRTVCADQMTDTVVLAVYEWAPLREFIAATVGVSQLHLMADPLARANVMSYGDGQALNWHFDRAEFTTTLLLQQPDSGGEFEFCAGLRSTTDIDHDGIALVIAGTDDTIQRRNVEPGTLNVFAGRHILHRVAPSSGELDRVIAVFSYAESADITFSERERIGFYGRS
jgi:hypothetical protein